MEYATKYKQLQRINCRYITRHIALSAFAALYKATGQISSSINKNRVQFLCLHHLFEDEENFFRNLLLRLSQGHRFITYSEAVDKILQGNIDRPYISLSFDDGLKSGLRAAGIMKELGIKACFFLCTSMIGETDYKKIKEFCFQRIHLPPVEFLSWDNVEALLKAGHEIASHTVTHPNLAQLSAQQMQNEIRESYDILTKRIGIIKHFSWPGGRFFQFSPHAARTVFETGFQSCACAERGCHVAPASQKRNNSLCIRRDHIIAQWPIDHILYFLAKNSGVASIYNNQWPSGWLEIIQGKN